MQALSQRLEAVYRDIATTRMAGLPVVHAQLRVQAVDFTAEQDIATGVLVTPWCMNLLRLPLRADLDILPEGHRAPRDLGEHTFEFTGAALPSLGRFEQCSLFSPMFDFADQAAAVATATEVLRQLRPATVPVPARRQFLFGRSRSHG